VGVDISGCHNINFPSIIITFILKEVYLLFLSKKRIGKFFELIDSLLLLIGIHFITEFIQKNTIISLFQFMNNPRGDCQIHKIDRVGCFSILL